MAENPKDRELHMPLPYRLARKNMTLSGGVPSEYILLPREKTAQNPFFTFLRRNRSAGVALPRRVAHLPPTLKGPGEFVGKVGLNGVREMMRHPELFAPEHHDAPPPHLPTDSSFKPIPPYQQALDKKKDVSTAEVDEYNALLGSQLWNPIESDRLPDMSVLTGSGPVYNQAPHEKKAQGQEGLPTASLRFYKGEEEMCGFTVEIARHPHELAAGLMHREELPLEHGMLFAFPEEKIQKFWMKDTYLPLDLIFLDKEGIVVGLIEDTEPFDEGTYMIDVPSQYVLEINAGRAWDCGIEEGWKAVIEEAIGE